MMKFNKYVVIKSKAMNGYEILVCGWNVQDIFEDKIVTESGNNRGTNSSNAHT
jgi:hypothetical protein